MFQLSVRNSADVIMLSERVFFFILLNIGINCTVGTKFERKLLQSIDNGGDIRVHFGYGNKKMLKSNRAMGPELLVNTAETSKVDILSGIFRNSVQQIRSKTKKIDVVYVYAGC